MAQVMFLDHILIVTDRVAATENGLPPHKATPLFDKLAFEKTQQALGGHVPIVLLGDLRASPGAAVKLCLGDLLVMGSNPETASLHMQG